MSSEPRTPGAIVAAEEEIAHAHVTLDLAVFERRLHPDYVCIQPGGDVEGKTNTIASLRSGRRHWDLAISDDMDVRQYGDTALVVGRWTARGVNGDTPFDYSARFLSVWIFQAGRWLNLSSQSSAIAP